MSTVEWIVVVGILTASASMLIVTWYLTNRAQSLLDEALDVYEKSRQLRLDAQVAANLAAKWRD